MLAGLMLSHIVVKPYTKGKGSTWDFQLHMYLPCSTQRYTGPYVITLWPCISTEKVSSGYQLSVKHR